MPILGGYVRNRKHLFGRQDVMNTVVAATRAYAFTGVPSVDLGWTDPEVDTGSRDPVATPYRGAHDLTAALDTPSLHYNDLPLIFCGFFGGGADPTGGGTAKTWVNDPASLTTDDLDPFTYEFGDDVLVDWYQLGDGVIESWEITGPEGLGALTASTSWRFGSVASTGSTDFPVTGTVPTPGLNVAPDEPVVYLKDGAIYIASTTAGLGAGQITDALHTFTLRGNQEIDQKRWANGDQSFDVDAYGPGARQIELECTFAKTSDTVGTGSESDAWMSEDSVIRYIRLTFTSKVMAEGIIPNSWTVTMPMRYYTREESNIGGNTVIVLTAHAFYDPDDLEGVWNSTVVNTLTGAELGSVGS